MPPISPLYVCTGAPKQGTTWARNLVHIVASGCPQVRVHMRSLAHPSRKYKRKNHFFYAFWRVQKNQVFFTLFPNKELSQKSRYNAFQRYQKVEQPIRSPTSSS